MPRRTALVTQHLENISRKALEEYSDLITEYVKGRSGIYALYRKNRVYYVGLASNLRARLNSHLKDKHKDSWDRFSVYLTIQDTHMRELEALVIRIVKPTGNKQLGKFAKSENLQKHLSGALHELHRREIEELLGKSTSKPKRRTRKKKIVREKGQPQLGPFVAAGRLRKKTIKAKYKRKTFYARVLKDGTISMGGERYKSPSAAALAVIDTGMRNGWIFWKYERSPGHWVPLSELKS